MGIMKTADKKNSLESDLSPLRQATIDPRASIIKSPRASMLAMSGAGDSSLSPGKNNLSMQGFADGVKSQVSIHMSTMHTLDDFANHTIVSSPTSNGSKRDIASRLGRKLTKEEKRDKFI